jgi:hypothetical protein
MNGGTIMANRNGMGPLNEGPLTGRGRGNCLQITNNAARIGVSLGLMGLAWGCRRGMGNRRRHFFSRDSGYNPKFQENPLMK